MVKNESHPLFQLWVSSFRCHPNHSDGQATYLADYIKSSGITTLPELIASIDDPNLFNAITAVFLAKHQGGNLYNGLSARETVEFELRKVAGLTASKLTQ